MRSVDQFNILFLSYWNVDDPLTSSTIVPHLQILGRITSINSVTLVCTQREAPSELTIEKLNQMGIKFIPIYSKPSFTNMATKVRDFIRFPKELKNLLKGEGYNFIIARGAPAGSLAYIATKNSTIPFIVESFEPHSDYMLFSKTWNRHDPRYIFQKYWEKQQKKYARALITVSYNYKKQLELEGVSNSRVFVAPCSVNTSLFYPDREKRNVTREKLGIPPESIVGVYAGKFGDLYYDDEAFSLFKEGFVSFENNFYLMILSNQEEAFIKSRINQFGIPEEKCFYTYVEYQNMPAFLNAADFAFATIKKLPVSKYQSPVKVGEYLACGLPVLLTEGIGDDSDFLEERNAGVLIKSFEKTAMKETFVKLKGLLDGNFTNQNHQLAREKRSISRMNEVYKKIFDSSKNTSVTL